jgi:hypothetical protein
VLRLPPRPGCPLSGRGVVGRSGVYVGQLSFQGEDGYTSARVHRVKGTSIDLRALGPCTTARSRRLLVAPPPGVSTHPSGGPKPTTLVADAKLPLERTVFTAQALGSSQPRFLAEEESSEGSIGIVRIASARGPRSSFAFDDSLSLGGVTPPPPFSGTATFQHGPGEARSWAGSLAVSFLGAPDVPLAGSPFKAQLARGW